MRSLLLFFIIFAACGGRQTTSEIPEELPIILLFMEENEVQALAYLEDMTVVLDANIDDPEAAYVRMEALLRVHSDEMIALARRIDERFQAMSPELQTLYTREWVAYFEPVYENWHTSMVAFRRSSGEVGMRLERMIAAFDELYLANELAEENAQ